MRKSYSFLLILIAICIGLCRAKAQPFDTSNINYGIWQSTSEKINVVYYEINGRLANFNWKDIEVAPNAWDWKSFDSTFTDLSNDGIPFVFMIYTKEDAPDWLYTNGVPKVIVKDDAGNVNGYAPYYIDDDYNFYFKRMITTVRQHVEAQLSSVRNQVIAVQACFGSTGDPISYKGDVDPQYDLTTAEFDSLFQVFSAYYYNEYKNTSPKIYLLSNTANDGSVDMAWLMNNCPGGWIKTGTLGKGFQLNDEKSKNGWLYPIMNSPQSGEYVRSRSEITGGATSAGWWLKMPYKNMYALMCYGIYWGLDMSNQGIGELEDALYDSSFSFFNKYAKAGSQKDAAKSTNALCALKDVLDAADSVRFPAATYGTIDRTNTQRYQNIVNSYSSFGARLEDTAVVSGIEGVNNTATGTNDVGWDLLPGNYERYLHQITPNTTSMGYWNVASSDANTMYGKYARGFDIANGKDGLYFDVDSIFLSNGTAAINYPVVIDIVYLDSGTGSMRLYYDAKTGTDKLSKLIVNCTNSNLWKKASITLPDAYFRNRGLKGSDFYIKSSNNQNIIFSTVELTQPDENQSNVGLFCSAVSAFDTACVNSTATAESFQLTGSFLNGGGIKIGPLNGFQFSTSLDSTYSDTLTISNYGTSVSKTIYVKMLTTATGTFSGNVSIKGGSLTGGITVYLTGTVINSSPTLSANVSNVTCNKSKNGIIDLMPIGGTGSFTYSWTSIAIGYFKSSEQDIDSLKPADYTVVLTSQAGCTTTATYNITEPQPLDIIFSLDSSIVCKDSNTTLKVTATGGNVPYTGTGTFTLNSGSKSYTVTDAKGCTKNESYYVSNGTLKVPSKPGAITGDAADAKGICGNGSYVYSITAVADATSYTWTPPSNIIVASANASLTSATLNTTGSFSSGTLNVTSVNRCGSSSPATKTLKAAPGKPKSITGPKTVVKLATGLIYSVSSPVSGLSYYWTVNNGAKITQGQNTVSITVNWSATNGKVTAKAFNACDTSSGISVDVAVAEPLAQNGQNGNIDNISALQSYVAGHQGFVSIIPNPAADRAFVIFNAKLKQPFTIEVTDVAGKILRQVKGWSINGENRIKVGLSDYASGVYLVSLTDAKGVRKTMRLFKN